MTSYAFPSALLSALTLCALSGSPLMMAQTATPLAASSTTLAACANLRVGANSAIQGFLPDASDAWHQDISSFPVAPNSDDFFLKKQDMAGVNLHPDFGAYSGIPYNVVDSTTTPLLPVDIDLYTDQSDLSVAPIPQDAAVEDQPIPCESVHGDQHLIVLDRHTCAEYEYWQASSCNGKWRASNVAIFDLATPEKRPYGFTSADAAGLSIFEGLIRYDEIVAGHIDHAIRYTTKLTKKTPSGSLMTAPATHGAGLSQTTDNIMGMRIRLRKDFDISKYSRTNQIILTAMKRYGMILADNGSTMFFQGTLDPRWDDDDLNQLKHIASSEFEVLQMGPVLNSSATLRGPRPQIVAFTASPMVSTPGRPVTLKATTEGASYAYVDQAGFLRDGAVVVRPRETTVYKLTVRNEYGSTSSEVTVQVR